MSDSAVGSAEAGAGAGAAAAGTGSAPNLASVAPAAAAAAVVFVASSLVSTAAAGGALSAAGEARPFSPDMVLSSRGGDGAVMSAHATGVGGWTGAGGAGDWRWCGWCRVVSVCGIVLGFWVWLGRLVQNGKSQLATRSSRAEWAAGCVRDSHCCGLRVEWLMTMRGSGVERPCAQDGRWWCCDGNGDGTGCDAMAMADQGEGEEMEMDDDGWTTIDAHARHNARRGCAERRQGTELLREEKLFAQSTRRRLGPSALDWERGNDGTRELPLLALICLVLKPAAGLRGLGQIGSGLVKPTQSLLCLSGLPACSGMETRAINAWVALSGRESSGELEWVPVWVGLVWLGGVWRERAAGRRGCVSSPRARRQPPPPPKTNCQQQPP